MPVSRTYGGIGSVGFWVLAYRQGKALRRGSENVIAGYVAVDYANSCERVALGR